MAAAVSIALPKPLLPPRGLFVPVGLIFDKLLPPAAKDTAVQLRALAWGQDETPPLSLEQLTELTGKSQSTLYGHMRLLRLRGVLRWRPAGTTEIIVVFERAFWLSENLENVSKKLESSNPAAGPNPAESDTFQFSRNLEKPVKDSREVNLLPDPKKNPPFQNSGKPESPPPAGTKAIQAEYVALLGYEPADWAAGEAAAAKWIGQHHTTADFRAAYEHYKGQDFWKDKRLKLSYLKNQLPEFQKTRKPPAMTTFSTELTPDQLRLQEQVRQHRRGGNGAQNR